MVLPYAFDTNDMRFCNGGFVFADDFAHYCIDAFDRLYEEAAEAPRMMSVGLHLRIIGRPGRIGGLERLLAHAAGKPGVWFARRDEIAHAWRAGLACHGGRREADELMSTQELPRRDQARYNRRDCTW